MILDDQDINFTPRSQKLLQLCKKIASELNYTEVSIVHLFAAFFELKKSRSIEVLVEAGLDLNAFRNHLYSGVLSEQPKKKNVSEFKVKPEVKDIIINATGLAKDLGHSWVSAEHIFLSIFKDIALIPDEIIVLLSIDLNFVTTKILHYLCDSEDGSTASVYDETNMQEMVMSANQKATFPILEKYASNMTKRALENKFDPVFGREKEIAKLEDILNRRKKNNAIIIGEAGVGKTAVVEGLVQNVINNKSSYFLNSKIFYELNLSSMIAGTKYRGEFEARIK